jgi:hypothetical protein
MAAATRALYSLIGVGLHGENGIDPETTISLLRTYVLPILYYGLEILLPTGKILEQLNIHYKKVLKQIGVHVWLSNFSILTLEVDFLDIYMDP